MVKEFKREKTYLIAPLYIFDVPKEELSLFDKLFYITIYGLTKGTDPIQLTNKYFMKLLNKSNNTISRSLKRLEDMKLIQRKTRYISYTGKKERAITIKKTGSEVIHAPFRITQLNITDGAKILLVQLTGLSKQEGYVYATNKALANKMNISQRMIYRYLNELLTEKFIFIENQGTPQKIIYINDNHF